MSETFRKRGLIAGFGTNQTVKSVEVFLKSAREQHSTDDTDVALVTNSVDGLEKILEETGAIVLNTPNNYSKATSKLAKVYNRLALHTLRLSDKMGLFKSTPEITQGYYQLLETWHHPQIARWYAYSRLLSLGYQYHSVVLADVKDVVFQSPLFSSGALEGVHLFEDGESFSKDGFNGSWYLEAYGEKAHQSVSKKTPICIGVIAGETASMQGMIREFCEFFAKSPFGKIEQAVFNHMVFENMFSDPIHIHPNFTDMVATLAGPAVADETHIEGDVIFSNATGKPIPIAHMYDRVSDYKAPVLQKYCAE